jgi:hydroxyethylthiazole kinase-like uncharacterized protein yjeF
MAIASADLRIYSVAQVRDIERVALAAVPGGTLMQRAGAAVADLALTLLSNEASPILVLAGPGNNGGDALEAAAQLASRNKTVSVVLLADPQRLPTDAKAAYARAVDSKVHFIDRFDIAGPWALAIDGLFGIGLSRPLEGPFRSAVEQINALDCTVLAIDVPSGLDADSGMLIGDGTAVSADCTLTLIADKPGLHTACGRDHAGEVLVDSLSIDPDLYGPPLARLITPALFQGALASRPHASHKGSFGDVSVIGGAPGMGGAVLLAARMAAMAGAGRVYAAFSGEPLACDPMHPELMCRDAQMHALSSGAVVVGPGLGLSRDAADILARALACALPLVIDADALNLIAAEAGLQQRLSRRRAPTLLTPHPLEAARLMGTDATHVQANRISVAAELAARFDACVILKGSGSIVAAPDGRLAINTSGNPALATAGSGDVLSGLCGALLAQGLPAWLTALAATWLHGAAADSMVAEGVGPVGVTAGELLPAIRRCLNQSGLYAKPSARTIAL